MKNHKTHNSFSGRRAQRRIAGKDDLTREVTVKVGRILDNLNAGATIMVRRLTTSQTIITNASGAVLLGTLCSSSGVSSATDFANMQNLFVAYRVKAMRVRVWPTKPGVVAGVSPPPALIATAEFSSGQSVTTYANMVDSAACRFITGYKPATFTIDWSKLTDAKLWTPTSAAIPSSEAFGIVYIGSSSAPAAEVSFTYFLTLVEYETEFITAA